MYIIMQHAWFSKKQFESNNERNSNPKYIIYETIYGKEVQVTTVSNTMEHGCNFDDME